MRPSDQKPLSAGMRITPQQQRTSGLLGALAADRGGKVYGLTARHVLSHGVSTVVLDCQQRILGQWRRSGPISSKLEPMADAIGLFRVSPTCLVDAAYEGIPTLPPPASIDELLGQRVHKMDARGRRPAIVTRLYGSIRLVQPTGGPSLRYLGAVELEPEASHGFSVRGDAGALVLTEAGQPFGILIAGSGRRYFVAPLMPVLLDHKLRLLTPRDAAIHNDNARKELAKPTPSNDEITNQFLAELGNLRGSNAGLTVIKRMTSSAQWRDESPSALAEALEVL
jgi:hypothetical protein